MATACVLGHPAAGHVNPTLPLIRELVARGERVTYFATEPFRSRIEETGARFQACGQQALFERNLAAGGLLGGMAGLMQTAAEILPGVLDDIRAIAPDYVLVEAHAVWGRLAAQILGRPTVAVCSMFAVNRSLLSAAELVNHLYGRAQHAATLEGLAGLTRYFEIARRVDHDHATTSPGIIEYLGNPQPRSIVLTSREFQVGGEVFDESYFFVGPTDGRKTLPLDHGLPLDPSRRVILVSMGTMYNDEQALYQECFDAFGGDDRLQVVLAAGHRMDRGLLPPAPPNVIVRDYVPQVAMLAQTELFITHGGINSAHEAMLNGVPMIVLPLTADHHVVAQRIAETGAGLVLERREATATRLRELADAVLSDSRFRAASRRIGETLRAAGGAPRAADAVLSYVGAQAA